jgi:hypothetical protein
MRQSICFLLPLVLLLSSCNNKELPEPKVELRVAYKLISVTDMLNRSGWGYEITVEENPFIFQPHIPALGGIHVFKSAEDASKVAELMTEKIRRKSNALPTISVKELVELGVINLALLEVETYQKDSGGWGFNILYDQISTISYEWFPGFEQGLPSKEAAIKVGNYVVSIMQQQFIYIGIERSDLKKLGIE